MIMVWYQNMYHIIYGTLTMNIPHYHQNHFLPSGKHTKKLWNITIFMGKSTIRPCSIAFCRFTRGFHTYKSHNFCMIHQDQKSLGAKCPSSLGWALCHHLPHRCLYMAFHDSWTVCCWKWLDFTGYWYVLVTKWHLYTFMTFNLSKALSHHWYQGKVQPSSFP